MLNYYLQVFSSFISVVNNILNVEYDVKLYIGNNDFICIFKWYILYQRDKIVFHHIDIKANVC